MITDIMLKSIMPSAPIANISMYSEAFSKILPKYKIDTPKRIAAFLGQIAVESGQLKFTKELPSKWNKKNPKDPKEPVGSLYEGRKLLGNNQPGDGPKFIGRGILQLTGRNNYDSFGKKVGEDLISKPELACDPIIATKIACQYFVDKGLLELADVWNLDEITRKVNGNAKLHLIERIAFSERALRILNAKV